MPPDAAPVIVADAVGKCYKLYSRPEDRLKQAVIPRVQRLVGRAPATFYKECWALRDISFEIGRGETLGIIGRNGSGKSTLLQIICGTLSPTRGSVAVSGRIGALLELGSGFNPECSGRENVHMNGAILGMTPDEIAAAYDDIIAFADIGDVIEQPVKTYSTGMYVRLAFAVIAHAKADILVIDEALSVGDVVFTQKCMRFLRRFKETGTLVFVSHDAASVLGLCETALWIDKGIVRMFGRAKTVVEAYTQECLEAAAGLTYKPIARTAPPASPAASVPSAPAVVDTTVRASFFDNITNSDGFTTDAAQVTGAVLLDERGGTVGSFSGGETVELRISAVARIDLDSPVIGFVLKDRLGQPLFGENTYGAQGTGVVAASQSITATFVFSLPLLPDGDYSMTVAIADGTPDHHVQHHWLHNAIVIKVMSDKRRYGLMGIPFKRVAVEIQ